MSLVLPTFAATDPVNATVLRDLNESVRRYVGEGIIAADRGAGQLDPTHVYRPDFFTDHAEMVSGAHWWDVRDSDVTNELFWTSYIGTSTTNGYYVPNLTRTIHIPENISTNGGHKVKIQASFAIWEFGGGVSGVAPACDESTNQAWKTGIMINSTIRTQTIGMKGSLTGGPISGAGAYYTVPLYPRKQMCLCHEHTLNAGVHDIGIYIRPMGDEALVRHRIVGQGCILVGFNCR